MWASPVELAARIVPAQPTLTGARCVTAACGAWTGGRLQSSVICLGGLRPGGRGRRDGAHDRADGQRQLTVAGAIFSASPQSPRLATF